jgi:hypothetical protein
MPVRRAKPAVLLPLVAKAHGTTEKDLVQAGTAEKMIDCQIHVDVLGTGGGQGERKGAWEAAAS